MLAHANVVCTADIGVEFQDNSICFRDTHSGEAYHVHCWGQIKKGRGTLQVRIEGPGPIPKAGLATLRNSLEHWLTAMASCTMVPRGKSGQFFIQRMWLDGNDPDRGACRCCVPQFRSLAAVFGPVEALQETLRAKAKTSSLVRWALTDLVSSATFASDTAMFVHRSMERLRHDLVEGTELEAEDRRKEAWIHLWTHLGASSGPDEKFQHRAKGNRHGELTRQEFKAHRAPDMDQGLAVLLRYVGCSTMV